MIKYNKEGTMMEVLTIEEILEVPHSQNMIDAIKNGYKTEDAIIEYCNQIAEEKRKEAIQTGQSVIVDIIGLFPCLRYKQDCSKDVVYELITPGGEYLYMRKHCY